MPVMDGFTATEKIRASQSDYASIPIIAVTANAMAKDKEKCIAVGMNDYLTKPLDLNLLKLALTKVSVAIDRAS